MKSTGDEWIIWKVGGFESALTEKFTFFGMLT